MIRPKPSHKWCYARSHRPCPPPAAPAPRQALKGACDLYGSASTRQLSVPEILLALKPLILRPVPAVMQQP